MTRDVRIRFWEKICINPITECHEWVGARNKKGYGVIRIEAATMLAHRLSWTLDHGQIEGGLNVLHHCDNPPCVNSDHLFLGTNKDNTMDCIRKNRTAHNIGELNHCKLTTEGVKLIWRRFKADPKLNRSALARELNVAPSTVFGVLRRIRWTHVIP